MCNSARATADFEFARATGLLGKASKCKPSLQRGRHPERTIGSSELQSKAGGSPQGAARRLHNSGGEAEEAPRLPPPAPWPPPPGFANPRDLQAESSPAGARLGKATPRMRGVNPEGVVAPQGRGLATCDTCRRALGGDLRSEEAAGASPVHCQARQGLSHRLLGRTGCCDPATHATLGAMLMRGFGRFGFQGFHSTAVCATSIGRFLYHYRR